jgi:transposase-like protein
MIPEAKRAQIIEALKSNPNRLAVTRQVGGVSHETVCVIARKLGIGLGDMGPKRFSSEARAKIVAALRANPNATAVAKEIGGISPGTVSAIAKEANIPLAAGNLAKAKRLSAEKRAQIIEALQANPNASMVARQLGDVSSRTVQKIAKKANIKLTAVNAHWAAIVSQFP